MSVIFRWSGTPLGASLTASTWSFDPIAQDSTLDLAEVHRRNPAQGSFLRHDPERGILGDFGRIKRGEISDISPDDLPMLQRVSMTATAGLPAGLAGIDATGSTKLASGEGGNGWLADSLGNKLVKALTLRRQSLTDSLLPLSEGEQIEFALKMLGDNEVVERGRQILLSKGKLVISTLLPLLGWTSGTVFYGR